MIKLKQLIRDYWPYFVMKFIDGIAFGLGLIIVVAIVIKLGR